MKAIIIVVMMVLAGCAMVGAQTQESYICIANRGSSTVSIVNTAEDEVAVEIQVDAPEGGVESEPMYCSYHENSNGKYLTVGDRANKAVIVYDAENAFAEVGRIEVGEGIFHHWVSPEADQIWIVCDGAGGPKDEIATYVASATTWQILTVIPMPEDLQVISVGSKGTLHDVIVDPAGSYAIVTTWAVPGGRDHALKYSTSTFELLGRVQTGMMAHCTLFPEKGLVYIASQGSLLDSITAFDVETLEIVGTPVSGIAGAHMLWGPSHDGHTFYATNLPGGGLDGLYAFNSDTSQVDFSATVDVPYSVPHNVAFNAERTKLYLTHSGPNTQTTIWDVSDRFNPRPRLIGEIQDGNLNPYGIFAFVSDVEVHAPGGGSNGNSASTLSPSSLFLSLFLSSVFILFLF